MTLRAKESKKQAALKLAEARAAAEKAKKEQEKVQLQCSTLCQLFDTKSNAESSVKGYKLGSALLDEILEI